jgi:hypothetical protein
MKEGTLLRRTGKQMQVLLLRCASLKMTGKALKMAGKDGCGVAGGFVGAGGKG